MRIQKKAKISASEVTETPAVAEEPILAEGADVAVSHKEAIDHIRAAIDCLVQLGEDDEVAKESVANLSVVLMDLQ